GSGGRSRCTPMRGGSRSCRTSCRPTSPDAMATEFCTLFDSRYLLKGLVLHETLMRARPDARLTVYCFDDAAQELLGALALPGVETIALAELERGDAELAAVKGDRSAGEDCWTATPSLPLDF